MRTSHPPIPQTDPRAGYLEQQGRDRRRDRARAGRRRSTSSAARSRLRAAFAAWLGTAHAVGVGSGTDAIELALRACGIGAGDLVFTVSHTAVATVAAIERAGAVPVLVDIEPRRVHDGPGRARSGRLTRRRRAARPPYCRCISTASRPIWSRSRGWRGGAGCGSSRIARRATARCYRGRADRRHRRHRLLQLLSDEKSRRARRRRDDRDRRPGAGDRAARDPRIRLARPLCQRAGRDQHAARPDPGGDPRRRNCRASTPTTRAARRSRPATTRGLPGCRWTCRRAGRSARMSFINT